MIVCSSLGKPIELYNSRLEWDYMRCWEARIIPHQPTYNLETIIIIICVIYFRETLLFHNVLLTFL